MSEGPEIEQKRRDLRAEKETLDGAMKIIEDLEQREREQQAALSQAAASNSQHYPGDLSSASTVNHHASGVHDVDGVGSPSVDRRTAYSATQYGDA
jgi:hypothetical protein